MMMQQMMQQMMNQGGGMMGNNMQQQQQQQPQAQAPKLSREEVMKNLRELGELKEMGILTEEEFNSKKAELLAQL